MLTGDTVDDGAGNRNNLLVVKPQAQAAEKKPSVATSTLGDAAAPVEEPQHSANILGAPDEAAPNLFTHETFSGESIQPLLKHESMKPSALNTTPVPVQSGNPSGKDQEYETDQDELASPLFRHESLGAQHSASSEDECASPLFRHESLSSTNSPKRRRSVRSSSASSHRSQAFGDENVSDHVLERFPTEMDSIIDQLHRASSRLPEDETDVDGLAPSPTLSQHGFESTTSPSFVASRENTDHLGSIDEDEDEELSPDEDNELPVPETAVPFETTEPGLNSPKLALSTSQPGTSHGQITPPMTPIDESQGSDELHGGSDDGSTNLKVPENIGSSTKSSSDDRDVIAKPASFWEWMGTFCGGRVGSV